MKTGVNRILLNTWQFLWACTLVCLPVTSFPLLSAAAGGTLVAPLAIIPLTLLCCTLIPLHLLHGRSIPRETIPLLFFVLVAIGASAAANFLDIPSFSDYTLTGNNLEGFVTLGIGLAFLLATWMMGALPDGLKKTLVFLEIGGMVLLGWSCMQLIAALSGGLPAWMEKVQAFISTSEINSSYTRFRIPGTTLEPSWLAHCLNILYLPLWLGFTMTRQSAFRFRFHHITVENLLLIVGIPILIFTYSRIGLLTFSFVLLWFVLQLSPSISARLTSRFFPDQQVMALPMRVLVAMVLVLMIVGAAGGTVYVLSLQDSRFESFMEYGSTNRPFATNLITIAKRMEFGERVISWDLGWKVFKDHPFLGVGLGNTGMFVLEELSPQAWKSAEIMRVVFEEAALPNSKNLWIRLLAETGIAGFSIFITWLLVLWEAARRLQHNPGSPWRGIGMTGQFTLLALLLEGFSLDTFALPYFWVALGLILAAAMLSRLPATAPGSRQANLQKPN